MVYRFLVITILVLLTTTLVVGQEIDFYKYFPFENLGAPQESLVIKFDYSKGLANNRGDLFLLNKIDSIQNLLHQNKDWVLVIKVYDDFLINGGRYSFNPIYSRSRDFVNRLIRKRVHQSRINFCYTHLGNDGFVNEELISNEKRVELLFYKLIIE